MKQLSKKKELKNKFFQRGVEAINALTGKNDSYYYCPICAQPFQKDALDVNELTLEHIPPEAQKGKGLALTCSRCNHTAGYTVDVAVSNRNEVLSIEPLLTQKGKYNGRVILSFDDSEASALNFNLSVKDSAVRFFPVEGSNPPDAAEKIKNFFLNPNKIPERDRPTFNVTTRQRYHGWYSKVGDLRTAYLVCFAYFGYRYAFDYRLDPVRNQILNYQDEIIDGFWLQSDLSDEPDTNLYINRAPFSALSVRIGKFFVLLPWFDSPENFYDFLINQSPENRHMNFTGTRLQWPKSLEMKLDFHNE